MQPELGMDAERIGTASRCRAVRPRVLVIDDEPDILHALALRLRSAGFDVLSASDGLQATQTAARDQPDVIVLDIGLPGGDGHVVARRLKSVAATATTPIIFLTARTSAEDRRKAGETGATGYVVKPFQPDELLALIEKALDAGRAT